jgi:dTDP-4-dehydrorhamnose reductase
MILSPSAPISSAIIDQKVLIVGADGVIGSALESHLISIGYQATGSTRRLNQFPVNRIHLDLEDTNTLISLERQRYETAVICGAVTSQQICEENPAYTRRINVDGTIALVELLSKNDTHIIFLSTNLVFDGSSPHCKADARKSPVNEYGRQKAFVEDYLTYHNSNTATIRLGKVLPRNFPLFKDWRSSLLSGNIVKPYHNKSMAPISLALAVKILAWLVAQQKPGVFQATACSDITYAEAALYLANALNLSSTLIKPIKGPDPFTSANHGAEKFHNTLFFTPGIAGLSGPPLPAEALKYAMSQEMHEKSE